MNTGEGGLHADLYPYQDNVIVQVASGRFGVNPEYLNRGAAIEIKVGQGAKPGIGGHLPGEKINREVSETRMIPQGSDAISPAPHHDIYSIEDLRQLIYSLKEASGYKPVGVKIAAVHNVAAIASGIVRAGADYVYLDGFRGGTGAAPQIIRDHVGIPIEIAIAVVDQRLARRGHPQPGVDHRRRLDSFLGRPGQGHRAGCRRVRDRLDRAHGAWLSSLPGLSHGLVFVGHHHPEGRAHAPRSIPSGVPSGSRTWCTRGVMSSRRSSARLV